MKEISPYYDLNPILSKKDINGNIPQKVIITGNRASGKSHAIEEHFLSFLRKKKYRKIAVLCRYKYEMDGIAERFFSVSDWKHPGMTYATGKKNKMGYADLILNDEHVGYGICVASSDNIKEASGLFKDVDAVVWDEFQREDNKYLPNEITQLNSIISSISRGEGKQGRFVRFFFLSNLISLLSPLMSDLEIEKRLKRNTTYVRGDGFVFEQKINLSALKAQHKAIGLETGTSSYLGSGVVEYLNDNRSAIKTPIGRRMYCETFIVSGKKYAILYYTDEKMYYCTESVDRYFKLCYSKDRQDVCMNVFVPRHITHYRKAFEFGRFCFENLTCKSALIKYISYGCN